MNGRLLRVLGTGFGLAVILGAAVGGEILRLPGAVARLLPAPGWQLSAWALGGAYAVLCASLFAELGTRLPRTSGLTAFADAALGPSAGFLVGWGDFLASAFTVGAYGLLAGTLLAERFSGPPRLWALGAVVGVSLLQWPGIRPAAWAQDGLSFVKTLLLGGLALGGLSLAGSHLPAPVVPPMPRPGLLAFVAAMQLVVFAYDNYYSAVYFGEEYTDVRRQLPRSLLAGVGLVMALYLLLAWGMSRGLDPLTLTTAELPGAALAARVFGPLGGSLTWGLMLLALFSGMNATLMIASRILLALGREGDAWRGTLTVNQGGTPVTGLAVAVALAVGGLALPSFEATIAFMNPFVLVNYGLSFLSLVVLRRRGQGEADCFRAPGLPGTAMLAMGISLLLLLGGLWAAPFLTGAALGLMALAWPLKRWLGGPARN